MSSFPPSISKFRRFSRSLNPHSILGVSLSHWLIQSVRRLLGNPPPGIVSITGHLIMNSDWSEVSPNSFSGKARSFLQFESNIEIDFVWRTRSTSSERNTNPHRTQNEAEVFEKLRPHSKIEKLTIERYKGRRFPIWLSDSSFSRILCIRLKECQYCSLLPSLGQLPGLKELYISGMAGLRSIGPEFYFSDLQLRDRDQQPFRSLETLQFDNLPNWQEWLDVRVTRGDLFPSLKKLFILRCPELTGNLPTFLPSLISLHIHKCVLLDFQPDHHEYRYGNLQTLSIKSSCDSLVTFPLSHFANLDKLEIDHCTSLHSLQLSNEHVYGLNSLRNLRINDCQNLQRLPELRFLSQELQVTISNCRYLIQSMEQQPQYQHPQFHLQRSNVSGSPRSHGSRRSYESRSPSRYD